MSVCSSNAVMSPEGEIPASQPPSLRHESAAASHHVMQSLPDVPILPGADGKPPMGSHDMSLPGAEDGSSEKLPLEWMGGQYGKYGLRTVDDSFAARGISFGEFDVVCARSPIRKVMFFAGRSTSSKCQQAESVHAACRYASVVRYLYSMHGRELSPRTGLVCRCGAERFSLHFLGEFHDTSGL